MNVFLADKIENEIAFFSKEESHHATKVLRLKIGDNLNFIDGKGSKFHGKILLTAKDEMQVKIESSVFTEKNRSYHLHLGIAPTKNSDRIEWMIEKAVEIGIDEISFIQCERSERKVLKMERIKKIVESATKQSLQTWLPKLNALTSFNDFIKENSVANISKFIAHCHENKNKKMLINQISFSKSSFIFLIGPEGDFSKNEIETALHADYIGLDLGPNRLRTETSGLFICMAAACFH